ncbi:uncharacterized protein LOC119585371 [Penaeus monodon]|uniref:uncharacterized protein LOC119585371 n=1 Tax=Penaeus monodon TaxID=6687 RepID=UPI0018A77651|nr:uncharacterized protein LOC119585371 [Penaeus monodon]
MSFWLVILLVINLIISVNCRCDTTSTVSTLCPILFSHGYLCSTKVSSLTSHISSQTLTYNSPPGLRSPVSQGAVLRNSFKSGGKKGIAASESFPKITSPLDPASSPAPVAEPTHTQCWLEPYKESPAQPSIPREVPETRSSAFHSPGYETSPIYTPAPTAHTPVNPVIKPDCSFDLTRCYESTDIPKTFATPPQNAALHCPLPAQDFSTSVMSSMKPKFGVEPDDFQLRNWTEPIDN